MEPISAIALSLALGAGAAAGKELVSDLVKDAYAKLKELVGTRYPKVSIDHLEQAPASKARRAGVEEELTACNAGQDVELATAAHELLTLIAKQAPSIVAATGVTLTDVEAANLRLTDIAASGAGVIVERSIFSGSIDISGVRAGLQPSSSSDLARATDAGAGNAIGVQLNHSVVKGNLVFFEAALSRADSSLDELCRLLDYRANKAQGMLDHDVVGEFATLHACHIRALRGGELILAHIILSEIQEFIGMHDPGRHIQYLLAPSKRTSLSYGEEYIHSDGFVGLSTGRPSDAEDRILEGIAYKYFDLIAAIRDEVQAP